MRIFVVIMLSSAFDLTKLNLFSSLSPVFINQTVQVQKAWYESVSDFKANGGGTMGGTKVGDIFERNAQKREGVRNNPYSGMGGGSSTSRGTARPNASNSKTSNPFGGFTSSAANSMSDIFDNNARRRDEHRRAGTGPYDPNQSALEEKLASLMKQAAEADERFNNLKRETMNADSSLKEQNVALRRDAAGFKARCHSLEEQLKTAQVKAAAAAKASSSAAAANRNTNNSLSSKEKAVLGEKIAALRKEAADAQAKCSAMEEQVAVAKARCESLEAALKNSKSELEEKKKRRWGFGSGNGSDDVPSDANEEKEALQAKVDELETSVRNHVKVVQKYKKECDALKEKAARGSDVNGADRSTGDASPPSRERSSLRQAFRMRVSGTAAKTADLVKEPSLKILNKLNRSRKNLTTNDTPTLDPPASSSTTIPTHGKRIPTGARAKARMMPNHKYTSKKSSEFASAVGIASGAVQEKSPEEEASVSSAPVSGAVAFRRASDRMYEKKIIVISGSVALLVVRSLLKAWIKGGML